MDTKQEVEQAHRRLVNFWSTKGLMSGTWQEIEIVPSVDADTPDTIRIWLDKGTRSITEHGLAFILASTGVASLVSGVHLIEAVDSPQLLA